MQPRPDLLRVLLLSQLILQFSQVAHLDLVGMVAIEVANELASNIVKLSFEPDINRASE
jgi:hypothetical protein